MGEGECPKTEVGGSVGDATKHILDSLNHLVDENLIARVVLNLYTLVCEDLTVLSVHLVNHLVLTLHQRLGSLVIMVVLATVNLYEWLRKQHPRNTY